MPRPTALINQIKDNTPDAPVMKLVTWIEHLEDELEYAIDIRDRATKELRELKKEA